MDLTNYKQVLQTRKAKNAAHLHSDNHQLADELSKLFGEPKRFGMYLKMAINNNHSFLRKIAAEVMENKKASTKGRLFAYLVKKSKNTDI